MKDSITDSLKEENIKLQKKSENLEARLFDLVKASDKQDKYTRRNNLELNGIPVDVKDEQLEQKGFYVFSHLSISVSKPDIEDYHRFGKSKTINRFVKGKVWKDALDKKFQVNRLSDNS